MTMILTLAMLKGALGPREGQRHWSRVTLSKPWLAFCSASTSWVALAKFHYFLMLRFYFSLS